MSKNTEEIFGEEISEKHKTTEVNILEEDKELTQGAVILREVKVGQVKDDFQVTLEEMIEVAVDQDQVLEQVPIEIELDASIVENMTTLPKIVQTCQRQKWSDRSDQTNGPNA